MKIGYASNLDERLTALAAMIPFETEIVHTERYVETEAARRRERQLHQRFAHSHHRGEWFTSEPAIAAYLQAAR